MNYIVLDMEWNQPFNKKRMVKKPLLLHGEIFEIGAVKLDSDLKITDSFRITIRPKYYKKVLKNIIKLTGVSDEDLQYGFEFPSAFRYFEKWCGEDFVFLTWGDDDIGMLKDNLILHELSTEWIPQSYNVQVIFNSQITKSNHSLSLSKAIEAIGEDEFQAHKALNDAKSTALICQRLDMEKGIAEYHTLKKQMKSGSALASLGVGKCKTYATKDEALKDKELTDFYCESLNETVYCSEIIKQSCCKYIAIGKCESGKEVFVRFKLKKNSDGTFRASRIIYEKDEASTEYYSKKKNKFFNLTETAISVLSMG